MTKLLIILAILFGAVALGFSFIMRIIRNFFSFIPPQKKTTGRDNFNKSQILYDKDDVVVMKGDAGEDNMEKED